jgi:drug/metabolite transporter (DMT)-like permease
MSWCLKHTTPIVAMAWEPIQPLSAAVLAKFFLEEHVGWWFVGGFALVMVGLVRATSGCSSGARVGAC